MGMDTEVAIRSNMSAGKSSFKSWLGIDTIVSYPNPTHRYRCLTLFTWSFSVSLFVWAMLMQCMFKLSLIPSTIYLSCNKNNPMQHHNHLNHPTQCTQILWKALHHKAIMYSNLLFYKHKWQQVYIPYKYRRKRKSNESRF